MELHIYKCPHCGVEEAFWGRPTESLVGEGFLFAHIPPKGKKEWCGEFNPVMVLVEIYTDYEEANKILSSRSLNYGRNWN